MNDTSGPTSALPSMRFDLASSSRRTCEATSLWDLEMSSPTFPEWGTTQHGELYELPTQVRRMVALASSSLPTPTARDWKDTQVRREPHRPDDTDTLSRALSDLLPTPTVSDTNGPGKHGTGGLDLRTTVSLLPTPTVMDMGANYTPEEWEAWKAAKKAIHQNGNGHGASLTQEAISLLPTPKAGDGERGRDLPRLREDTNSRELATAAGWIGASTSQPSDDGNDSPDPHPTPPSPAPTDGPDSLLDLLSGSWD